MATSSNSIIRAVAIRGTDAVGNQLCAVSGTHLVCGSKPGHIPLVQNMQHMFEHSRKQHPQPAQKLKYIRQIFRHFKKVQHYPHWYPAWEWMRIQREARGRLFRRRRIRAIEAGSIALPVKREFDRVDPDVICMPSCRHCRVVRNICLGSSTRGLSSHAADTHYYTTGFERFNQIHKRIQDRSLRGPRTSTQQGLQGLAALR